MIFSKGSFLLSSVIDVHGTVNESDKSCDGGKPLFAVCPADHPFAFQMGKMCCDCEMQDSSKELEFGGSICECNSLVCPDGVLCGDKVIGTF